MVQDSSTNKDFRSLEDIALQFVFSVILLQSHLIDFTSCQMAWALRTSFPEPVDGECFLAFSLAT